MAQYLYALGPIMFNTDKPLTALDRDDEYRWAEIGVLQKRPGQQWIGPGTSTMAFQGTIFAAYQTYGGTKAVGIRQIEEMRTIAEQGNPLVLVDGTGKVYGRWVIKHIREHAESLLSNGAPRKQEFTLTIARYGESTTISQEAINKDNSNAIEVPRMASGTAYA